MLAATALTLQEDDLSGAAIQQLLRDHLQGMHDVTPPESVHALDINGLRAADVTFWSAWQQGELAGCAALRELSPTHGEVKSMRTAPAYLRRGIASTLLQHIIEQAQQRTYHRLSLETGAMEAFAPARALYKRFGFQYCGPFGDYTLDPNSTWMTKTL